MISVGLIFIPQVVLYSMDALKILPKTNRGTMVLNTGFELNNYIYDCKFNIYNYCVVLAAITCYFVLGACLSYYP